MCRHSVSKTLYSQYESRYNILVKKLESGVQYVAVTVTCMFVD